MISALFFDKRGTEQRTGFVNNAYVRELCQDQDIQKMKPSKTTGITVTLQIYMIKFYPFVLKS